MTGVQTLEFLKYFTLVGKKVGFENNKDVGVSYHNEDEEIETPEGIVINLGHIRISWDFYFHSERSDSNYWFTLCIDKNGQLISNPIPDLITTKYLKNGIEHNRHIYYSDFYKNVLKNQPEKVDKTAETYNNPVYIQEHSNDGYYPSSLVISILSYSQTEFDNFMNLSLDQWKEKFSYNYNKFIGNFSNWVYFETFIKYPPNVIFHALTLQDHKAIIIALINKWDNEFDSISFDIKYHFIIEILDTIVRSLKSEDKENIKFYYNIFFENGAEYFKKLALLLNDSAKLHSINIYLISLFYNQKTEAELESIKQDIKNGPDKHLQIPIVRVKAESVGMDVLVGANPIILYENKIKLKYVEVSYLIDMGSYLEPNTIGDSEQNPFKYLKGMEYGYDELVYCFCVQVKLNSGLTQGRYIPIPAFAIDSINKSLSEDYTIGDLLDKMGAAASLLFPYFAIAEGIFAGEVLSGWLFITNAVSGGLVVIDTYVSTYIQDKIMESNSATGKLFLYTFKGFVSIWAIRDGWNGIIENLKMNKFIFKFDDIPTLLGFWVAYSSTDQYKELLEESKKGTQPNGKVNNLFEVDTNMIKIQKIFNENNN